MASYEELKRRVANGEKPTAQKEEKKSTYEELKDRARQKRFDDDVRKVDSSYIDLFVDTANRFFDSAEEDYGKVGWGNAYQSYLTRRDSYSDLEYRRSVIQKWMEDNKDRLDADSYRNLSGSLEIFGTNASGIVDNFSKARDFYSQFDTEDDYDAFVAQQEEYEAKKNFDLKEGEREIQALEKVLDEYKTLTRFATDEQGAVRASQIRQQYGDEKAIKELISRKKQYLNQARHIQEGITLSGVAGNDDFNQNSGYQSTQKENPAWWESGIGDTQYEWINNQNGFRDQWEQDMADLNAKAGASSQSGFYTGPKESTYKELGYDRMTEQEVAIYNYYYTKEGKDKAQEYLDSIQESLNYRKATEMFSTLEGNTALEMLFGVNAGLDQFRSGMSALLNTEDDYIAQSAYQIASGMVREDLADNGPKILGNSLGQVGYDAITTTANMAPSILTSMAIGMVNPLAGQIAGSAMMGASAAGNAYQEALNQGFDKNQARGYGLLVGASEIAMEKVLGGISALGGNALGKFFTKNVGSADTALKMIAKKLGGSMLSEFSEEYLQEVLTPVFQNIMLGTDNEVKLFSSDALYSGILGALTAGVMEGPSSVSSEVNVYTQGKQLQKADISAQRLAEIGSTFAADTVAYKIAGKVDENTGAYTMGRLFNEISATLTEQNVNDITEALMAKGMSKRDAKANARAMATVVEGGHLTDRQVAVIEANDVLAEVMRTTIIDPNATWFQRTQGYNEALMALAQEKTAPKASRMNPAEAGQENVPATDTMDSQTEAGTETVSEAEKSSGKAVSISSIQKGVAKVKLEDGSEVDLSEADLDPDEAVRIETIASIDGISAQDANYILSALRAAPGATAQVDSLGAKEAYKYGFYGFSQDHIAKHGVFANSLTETQRKAIYETGRTARQMQVQKATSKQATSEKSTAHGKVHFEGDTSTLTERQSASLTAMEKIADILGVQIYVFESEVGANGKRIGANGWYDPKDNSIHIDLHAGAKGEGTMLFTLAHELTHHIRKWSPAKFKTLADFLMQEYGKKGVNVDGLVREQMAKAQRNGRSISYDTAYEEVVADSMETMLSDGNVMEKLAKLKAKDQSLWQKIKDFINELAVKIRSVYEGLTPDSVEGRYVAEMVDSIERLQDLFAEALVDASDNYHGNRTHGMEETMVTSKVESATVSQKEIVRETVSATPAAKPDKAKRNGNFSRETYKKVQALTKEEIRVLSQLKSGSSMAEFSEEIQRALRIAHGRYTDVSNSTRTAANAVEKLGNVSHEELYHALNKHIEELNREYEKSQKDVLFSARETEKQLTPGEEGVVTNRSGEAVAYATEDGSVLLSMRTYEEDGREAFRKYLQKCVSNKKLTKAEMQEMLDGIEEIYATCKEFKDQYAPFSSWSDAAVVRDTHGRPVFSVVTPNGDYKMNLDFSLVCKKRRTLDAVFNEMSRRGVIDDFELGQKSVVKINEIIRKYGLETACALCFVDAKRFRQASMADQFTSLYNELVESLVPEDQKGSIDHFNFSGYDTIKKVEGGIDTWDNSKLDFSHLDHVMKTYGSGTVEYKAAKYIKNNPQGRKLLLRGDFMSSQGFDAVKTQNQDILKLYNSKKGTGGPKAAFGDVQYMNEIIKKARTWTPAKAYAVGGVRIQSFSDYVPRMVFDYTQMIYDLAATKLPAHAYTKEALFVKQFGLTGVKINMSLIPAIAEGGIAPGLDANGDYVWAGESFDFETAKQIQNAPGYTENCGTICVGVSDRHIRKLLSDPDIRMVIPYHKSGLNPIVAHMNRIAEFTDYTNKQNTTVKETGAKAEKHFDFNKALHDMGENADPRAVIQQYFDWCDDNGYEPKFAEFRDHPNYYKLIEDFTLFDKDGNYVPQREVRAVFPKADSAFGSMKDLIQEGLEEDAVVEGKRESSLNAIVDEIQKTLPKTEAEIAEEQVAQADRDLEAETKFSIREEFYEEFDAWDKKNANVSFITGTTSDALRSIGMKDQDIVLRSGTVLQKLKDHPEMTLDIFKKIPELLEHPVIVQFSDAIDPKTKRPKYDSSITVLGELYADVKEGAKTVKKPVLVSLELMPTNQKKTAVLDFAIIKSAYSKNALQQYINENSILYIDPNKKRTDSWLSLNRLQLPLGEKSYGPIRKIAYVDGKVKVQSPKSMSEMQKKLYEAGIIDEFGNKLFSDRDTDSVSNRSLLANAFEGVAKNGIEKQKIQEYKGKISLIEAEERKLQDLNEKIKDLSFAKGPKDTKAIRDLQFEAKQTANRISTYDKQLLRLEASKPLQDVLTREKKMAYQRAEKKGKEALAAYRERATKTQRELMDKWQESRKRGVESREKTAMRHKIQSVVGELNQLLLTNDKKRHVPDSLKKAVADALALVNMDTVGAEERAAKYANLIANETDPDKIDAYTVTMENILRQGEKMGQRLKELRDAYEEIQESDDPDIANAYDPVIAGCLKELSQSIGNTSLRNMTIEQLSDVYDMYRMVLTRVRDANKTLLNEKKESISNLASRVVGEVRKSGGEHTYRVAALDPVRKFLWNNLKPVYAFEHLGSATLTEAFNGVRKGEDTWAKDVTEARAYYLDKSRKYGYDGWDFKMKYRFESDSGIPFELTLEQILSLYAYSKREQAHDHLRLGGFVFDSNIETYKDKDSKLIKYKVNTADAHQITPEILASIIGTLSQEQMAFVDEMQAYLSTTMGAKGNEVTMKMYGVKLFKEKHYFPLKSAKQFMFEQNEVSGEVRIKNSGFTNKTVAKANNPVILSNFMDVWSGHVNAMSMYHAFVLPLEDFNRIFNYNSPKKEGQPPVSVKGTIQSAYSPAAVSYVKSLITDLNGGARSDSTAGIINKMMGLFKKGSVFASLSVVVQQPSAIARAAALVNTKYFIGPKVDSKRHKLLWEEVKKYAPVAIIKEMGYFDTNMGKSTQDFILAKEYSGIKDKMKALVTDSDYRDEILSKAPALADEMAWCSIWEAVKREMHDKHPGLDVKGEPFLMLAGSRFTEVITKTQVYDSVLSRSANMRSKDTGMKMATAFMAEPTTSINMIADALLQGKRGNKKYARATIGAVVASQIFNSILVSFVYAGRDDDEDKTYWEKYLGTLSGEIVDSLNPAGYIPFIKDIQSIVQGYDVERSDMAVVSDLWNAWKKLGSDNLSVYRKVEGFAGSIAQIFGLPVKNIMRDVRGIWQTIESFMNGQQTTKAGIGYAVKAELPKWMGGEDVANQQQLYEALISGDQTQIARVKGRYKDESAVNSAIRKALRENDPRIKAAAQAKVSGDLDEYMRLAKAIIGEKHFSQDNVVAAINAEINALSKDEDTSSGTSKASGMFKTDDFATAIAQGDTAMANAIKTDIIQTAQKNGKTEAEAEKSFASSASGSCKELFMEGQLSEGQAINALVDFCGVEQEDAEKRVGEWAFQKEYGFTWSDRGDAYKSGEITANELKDILVDVGGKTEEEADLQIQVYDWEKEVPGCDDITASAIRDYNENCAAMGISKSLYYEAWTAYNDIDSDYYPDGDSIPYSKTKKVMPYINSLPLTPAQKTALALCWWAEKTVNKYKLW